MEGRGVELNREMRGLKNDQNMTRIAVESQKNRIAEELCGDMGEDMNAVLKGEKFVELEMKFKIRDWFRRLFRMF
jgi:hypothetical protein